MVSIILSTPHDVLIQIAERARLKRLELNLSQITLSAKSGVSYGVIKKFERTGQISLESLLKLALALGSLQDFNSLFITNNPEHAVSLDDLLASPIRKRGRK